MESKNNKRDPEEGRIRGKVLPLERRVTKDISQEPEMKELERMIEAGELEPKRLNDYLEDKDGNLYHGRPE